MLFTASTNTLKFNINEVDKIFVKYPHATAITTLVEADFTSMTLGGNAANPLANVRPSVTSCKLYYRKINDPISELKLKNMV